MLNLLKIRNLALVDSLKWNIDSGLIGVTGETGAGKSVIVGALKLVLGERADKSLIRTGEDECRVEAVFEIKDSSPISKILEEAGIEAEDDSLIIKRIVGAGTNKQFVNDSACTLALLKRLGTHLVDLHGPHDHQSLLSNERQLSMLDAFAGAQKEFEAYSSVYQNWRSKVEQLEELLGSGEGSSAELELFKFQLEEIESADIEPTEEKRIEERYHKASNGSRLLTLASQISSALSNGVNEKLGEIQSSARDLEALDPATGDLLAGLDTAVLELQDLERSMKDYADEVEVDPAELNTLEERINTFETLKRKYGPSLDDVLAHASNLRNKLDTIENRDGLLEDLEKQIDLLHQDLIKAGTKLSTKRKKIAPRLAKEISLHLRDLGFKQADFSLRIDNGKNPQSCGLETVDFQFGPNPGEPLKPLKSIASSGEVSRVMLAVKTALAKQDFTPLMVFDEIDANVGGEIARSVGEKMAGLGKEHQVISITHFPQVAAVAHQHFVVSKNVEEGRTVSRLTEVEGEERVAELVRMLGGGEGEQAREMATSLLSN